MSRRAGSICSTCPTYSDATGCRSDRHPDLARTKRERGGSQGPPRFFIGGRRARERGNHGCNARGSGLPCPRVGGGASGRIDRACSTQPRARTTRGIIVPITGPPAVSGSGVGHAPCARVLEGEGSGPCPGGPFCLAFLNGSIIRPAGILAPNWSCGTTTTLIVPCGGKCCGQRTRTCARAKIVSRTNEDGRSWPRRGGVAR